MGLGLALSGGGIKGAAHIGVLKALEEEKVTIDYIGRNVVREHSCYIACYGIYS